MDTNPHVLEAGTLEGEKQLITVLLAQFGACRAEIQARSANQAALINLNISAVGVIAGFYFAYGADPRLLFLIPLLSPMLGIIWADHAINIGNIGRFIQDRIMPSLRATLKQPLPDYELRIRHFEAQMGARLLLLIAPMAMLFAIIPAASLVIVWSVVSDKDIIFWMLFVSGSALILTFGLYSVMIFFSSIWNIQWPDDG